MTDSPKKKPLTTGRALDKLEKLRADRHHAADEAIKRVYERFAEKETALLAGFDEAMRDKVLGLLSVEAGRDIGGFGVEPGDSKELEVLRSAIDDHLGWLSEEQEEEADYVARVIGVGLELRALRAEKEMATPVSASIAPDVAAHLSGDVPKGGQPYEPGPAARRARGQ